MARSATATALDTLYARASELPALLRAAWDACVAVLVVGASGIGKTDIIGETAHAYGAECFVAHPVVEDPTYGTGLPWPAADGNIRFRPFGTLARVLAAGAADPAARLVWFLDEFGQAPASVQAAYMAPLLAGRTAGGDVLPAGLRWVLATNRRTDRAGVTGILGPVVTRCLVVHMRVDVADWCDWASTHAVDPRIIGYIRAVPDALIEPTDADMEAAPNPRTWARASAMLALAEPVRTLALAGLIGSVRASAFAGFLKLADAGLPSWEAILRDPTRATLPTDASLCYAVASMVAARVDAGTLDKVYPYIERLSVEYRVACVSDAYRRCNALGSTAAFRTFAANHAHVFMAPTGAAR